MPADLQYGAGRRSSRSAGRPLVVMEWIVGPGNVGLALTFYTVKSRPEAIKLCERIKAIPLPMGATERTLTVREIERFPATDSELMARLEVQQQYVRAILAGLAADEEADASE